MDISNIPRTFWHSLSFCMVVSTVGLLVIAYKASSVSIKIANAKIELSSAVSQTKEIKADLEAESARMITATRLFQKTADALAESAKSSKSGFATEATEAITKVVQELSAEMDKLRLQSEFGVLDAKIRSAQEAIRK